VGIVGAGWIAADHVKNLAQVKDATLVAVCDVDETRARALAGSAKTYTDWRAMVEREKPEAVIVATPPATHREVAVPLLEQGIHVYLEKPIARGLRDARAIIDTAAASRAVCAVGYQWHALDLLDDVRAALQGQEVGLLIGVGFGPTKSRPWFLNRKQGGGNLLERASHQIDLERAVGGEVERVQAAASKVLLARSADGQHGDIDDAAALTLHFKNGGVGAIQIAWTRDGMPGSYALDVVASNATLHLALDPDFILKGVSAGKPVEAKSRQHPLLRSLEGFIKTAQKGDKNGVFCPPANAAGTLAVAVACEEALESGGTVPVPSY
jgi:predicted dehydrogenase